MNARRVIFVERLAQGKHLCAFCLADLALDSPSYTSGATGIDVLWSGLPLLAMAGGMRASAFSSRLRSAEQTPPASTIFQRNSVSLLAAARHPNSQAHSSADYVRLGLSLALTDRRWSPG